MSLPVERAWPGMATSSDLVRSALSSVVDNKELQLDSPRIGVVF